MITGRRPVGPLELYGDLDRPLGWLVATPAARLALYRTWIEAGYATDLPDAVRQHNTAQRHWTIRRNDAQRRWWTWGAQRWSDRRSQRLARIRAAYKANGLCCVYCGSAQDICVDHVIPKVRAHQRGGIDAPWNLAPACRRCNAQKHARTPEEWRAARLRRGLPWPPPPQYGEAA
ncbi:HNH endonuclease signature motif containing protein [Micromonospora chersina]|uniref:HNH endonuclease signature motif containing protein n=1 Tax=Micromonospora chersina TaxID=47854 RepID=UPI003721EAC6